MNKLTSEQITEAIKEVAPCYLNDILNAVLQRLHNQKDYAMIAEIDGYQWNIECINPYGELYPEKIL